MCRQIYLAVTLFLVTMPSARAEHVTTIFAQAFYGNLALGKGARAWGMGGTGLAITGDPEASSWNPASLVGIDRPWLTFSLANENLRGQPREFPVLGIPPYGSGIVGTITESTVRASGTGLEHLAFAYPFRISDMEIVGQVSYERRIPYSLDFTYAYEYRHDAPGIYDYGYVYDASASGGIDVLTFSVASQVAPWARLGLNVHRWLNGFSIPVHEAHDKSYWAFDEPWNETRNDELTFDLSGFSADIGAQFLLTEWLTTGLLLRPGFAAGLNYANAADFSSSRTGDHFSGSHRGRGVVRFPHAFGLGFSIRPMERLLASFDVVGVLWSDSRIEDYSRATSQGDVPAPNTYLFPTMERRGLWAQGDTSHFRTGAEYTLSVNSADIPIRLGTFHEKLLAYDRDGETQYATGITLGIGLRWRKLVFDLAWIRNDAQRRYEYKSLRMSIRYAFP
jgi:hypothetical protein